MTNFISREEVLDIIRTSTEVAQIEERVSRLFSFPAPNPDWQHTDRNIMGQTEEEFWDAVELSHKLQLLK